MSQYIDKLCEIAEISEASDIFLHEHKKPLFKIQGRVLPIEEIPVSSEQLDELWNECRAEADVLDMDTSYTTQEGERFRVNLFRYMGARGAVLRWVRSWIPDWEHLRLPADILQNWCMRTSGLILICGSTGAGKSTTLASCLNWINQNEPKHIVTIEDPVEYLFFDTQAVFTQREVGPDTPSYLEGLRQSLRQAPDVIMVGEIREASTAVTVLQACETGHLVFSTLHASSSVEALDRFIQLLPVEELKVALSILSSQLVGVLCQKLLPARTGGVVPVEEYFENRGAIRKWIRESRVDEISEIMNKSRGEAHTKTFLSSLVEACRSGLIEKVVAEEYANNSQEFKMAMQGINVGEITGRG